MVSARTNAVATSATKEAVIAILLVCLIEQDSKAAIHLAEDIKTCLKNIFKVIMLVGVDEMDPQFF